MLTITNDQGSANQNHNEISSAVQFSSVAQSCPTLCDPMNRSTPGFIVVHYLPEFAQIHVHWVYDAIQWSHPLSPPSVPAVNFSQHQGLFQRVGSLHQMAKVLELQLQHQSLQWIIRIDFLYGPGIILRAGDTSLKESLYTWTLCSSGRRQALHK